MVYTGARSIPLSAVAAAALAIMLGACTIAPTKVDQSSHDYRLRHDLNVKPVVARVGVEFENGDSSMSASVRSQLEEYFDAYLKSGRGTIEMTVYSDGSDEAVLKRRVSVITDQALDRGVRRNEISSQIGALRQDHLSLVEIKFRSHIVQVPACRDWSRDNIASFDNAPTTNFGCATQANLGKMVADPGDLIHRREVSDQNTASVLRVIGRHEAGESPSSSDNPAGPATALGATQ